MHRASSSRTYVLAVEVLRGGELTAGSVYEDEQVRERFHELLELLLLEREVADGLERERVLLGRRGRGRLTAVPSYAFR